MRHTSTRNLQLDVLRGIAIVLVFGRHMELPRPPGMLGVVVELWYRVGWIGVDLFFVLSGFLIGGLLITELSLHGRLDIQRFLIRRGLKIYPPYFVFVGYLMLGPTLKALARGDDAWRAFGAEWQRYWPNLLFLQNYIGHNPAGHTWTLAVEEHFYLALPFALLGLSAVRRPRLMVPLCLVVVPAVLLGARFHSVLGEDAFSVRMAATHLRLDALLFGVGLRGLAEYSPERFILLRRWRAELTIAGVLLWGINLFIAPSSAFIRTIGLTCTFLGAAAFLVVTYQTTRTDLKRWKAWVMAISGGLAWIGVYSYAIYLWHVTAMGMAVEVIGTRLLTWTGMSTVSWLIAAALVISVAIIGGALAGRLVEWPIIKLRDRVFPSRTSLVRSDKVALPG